VNQISRANTFWAVKYICPKQNEHDFVKLLKYL